MNEFLILSLKKRTRFGCSSVVEKLPSMNEVLGLIPNTEKEKEREDHNLSHRQVLVTQIAGKLVQSSTELMTSFVLGGGKRNLANFLKTKEYLRSVAHSVSNQMPSV